MRILITGGAGFIGSHVVGALVEAGEHELVVLDSLVASPDGEARLEGRAELIVGDVADPDAVARAVRGVDAVCHQAAKVGLGLDVDDIADYVRDNDLGTAVLLRALAAAGFRGRLVLASSMVVYGEGGYTCASHGSVDAPPRAVADLDRGVFDPACPHQGCGRSLTPVAVPESARLDPRNVYAATKLQQEHLCSAWARETGAAVTALRYHNVYGPRMPRETPYAGVASIFASAVAAGRPPRVFEDGGQLRDFVHVRDVARANLLALTSVEPALGAFNVCSGRPRSVGEMAVALSSAAGPDAPEPEITGQYRRGDIRHVFASPARAAAELGFVAQEDFGAGMAEFGRAPLGTSA